MAHAETLSWILNILKWVVRIQMMENNALLWAGLDIGENAGGVCALEEPGRHPALWAVTVAGVLCQHENFLIVDWTHG